jgi:hypothetical protein
MIVDLNEEQKAKEAHIPEIVELIKRADGVIVMTANVSGDIDFCVFKGRVPRATLLGCLDVTKYKILCEKES